MLYRFPTLFVEDTFRHFGPLILNLQIKSPFLTRKVSFCSMWIVEFAYKKSANIVGCLYSNLNSIGKDKGHFFFGYFRHIFPSNRNLKFEKHKKIKKVGTFSSIYLQTSIIDCFMTLDLINGYNDTIKLGYNDDSK